MPEFADGFYAFPRRSIVSLRPVEGGVEVLCDCATVTVLTFDAGVSVPLESAFTCDGCLTVHWFELTVAESGCDRG